MLVKYVAEQTQHFIAYTIDLLYEAVIYQFNSFSEMAELMRNGR